jgi:hypothetical protein
MTVSFPAPNIGDGWMPAFGVAAAEDALGHDELIDWCIALLTGTANADRPAPSLRWLAGAAAGSDSNRDYWARKELEHWPRVWASRALRYVCNQRAAVAVFGGLDDREWRVREHCCAIAGLRELADAADRLAELTREDREAKPRVRLAAVRALALVGDHEYAQAIRRAVNTDPDPKVSEAAEQALHTASQRLDRQIG